MGRFSTATGASTIIGANREWSDSHANVSRLCSSAGWHRNESLCTKSKEKTRRALKILRFFRHFSTTRTYLGDNRERERGPIVSVGVDPTGTFWPRLTTFDVHAQITIATRQETSICPSCESPIMKRFHAHGRCFAIISSRLDYSHITVRKMCDDCLWVGRVANFPAELSGCHKTLMRANQELSAEL